MSEKHIDITGLSDDDLELCKTGCYVGCLSDEAQINIAAQLDVKDASQYYIPKLREPLIVFTKWDCPILDKTK